MTRRDFLRSAAALPAAYLVKASPLHKKVKITDMKVMLVRGVNFIHPMVKVETDAGITGVGESYWGAGIKDLMLTYCRPVLLGQDPLAIDVLYTRMIAMGSGAGSIAGATVTAVSGVEIALWDLAGKILEAPVYELLGGRYRDSVRAYWTAGPGAVDKAGIQRWAETLRSHPFGFTALKIDLRRHADPHEPRVARSLSRHLSTAELKENESYYSNIREVLGDGYEFSVHCHWEFDLPDALALTRAVAPARPWWIEDPMPPEFSDSWTRLTAGSPVPILTGENLYTRHGFQPFITQGGCHLVQIDIPKSGGLLEAKKIADLADIYAIPVCAHNVASPLGTMASAHAAAAIRDFRAHESAAINENWSKMVIAEGPIIKDGRIQLFEKPGIGVELNPDWVNTRLAPGEQWWG